MTFQVTDKYPKTPIQGNVDTVSAIPSRHRSRWIGAVLKQKGPVWLVATATLANGALGIMQVLLTRFHEHPRLFNLILPFGLHHWGRSLTVAFGFMLVYLSFHLFQRRKIAWMITMAVLILAVAAHIGRGHLWYSGSAPLVTAMLLFIFRKQFTVRSEPSGIAQGVILMVASLLIALAYGTAGFWLLDQRDFGLVFNGKDALIRTLREFTLVGNSDLVPYTRHARWFLESLRLLGILASLLAGYSLFRPLAYRLRTLPHDRTMAKNILAQYGRSSLDFFKLWPDKSYLFSGDYKCFIAYKASLSVAISLGDPVGPEDCLEDATSAFLRYCADNGWLVAFHQVLPDLLPMYRQLGLQVLKIGEEAIIDLERFSSHTVQLKHFRHIRRKFEGLGYILTHHAPPHPRPLLEEVKEVSDEWLSLPGRRERGFSLGRFEWDYLNETPLFAVRNSAGQIIAFANEIPAYQTGTATIDLMRHRTEIPNGVMEYLFTELLLYLKETGYRFFNLGMAPFAGVGDRPGATLQERAVRQLYEHLNRFFSYKGLRNYKAKFEPNWEDRFLLYQGGPVGLLKTAIALTRITEG
ncbi:MAG: DUF2156 domain-containing protein [Chloroflexi bacterium]|nr:DUF2156 domain-containing protein [Chloroflexota bacterium]